MIIFLSVFLSNLCVFPSWSLSLCISPSTLHAPDSSPLPILWVFSSPPHFGNFSTPSLFWAFLHPPRLMGHWSGLQRKHYGDTSAINFSKPKMLCAFMFQIFYLTQYKAIRQNLHLHLLVRHFLLVTGWQYSSNARHSLMRYYIPQYHNT